MPKIFVNLTILLTFVSFLAIADTSNDKPFKESTAKTLPVQAGKTEKTNEVDAKSGDIDQSGIFYKVYHTALKAQNGDTKAAVELMHYTFADKPQELTAAVVKAVTLAMLKVKSKSAKKYFAKVNRAYPNNTFLHFLKEAPFNVRGTGLNKDILATEYEKSLQHIIDLTPKLAAQANTYIGIEAIDTKLAEKIESDQQKKVEEVETDDEDSLTITEIESIKNPRDKNLAYAVLEFKNYLKVQEKRTKSSIFKQVYAKYVGRKAILFIESSDDFQQLENGYKEQLLDGFYRFWKLRSRANGSGSNVDLKLLFNGKDVGGTKDGTAYLS